MREKQQLNNNVSSLIPSFLVCRAEMTADKIWRSASTEPLLTAASLVEFVVLDCEPYGVSPRGVRGDENIKSRSALWDVVVSPFVYVKR